MKMPKAVDVFYVGSHVLLVGVIVFTGWKRHTLSREMDQGWVEINASVDRLQTLVDEAS